MALLLLLASWLVQSEFLLITIAREYTARKIAMLQTCLIKAVCTVFCGGDLPKEVSNAEVYSMNETDLDGALRVAIDAAIEMCLCWSVMNEWDRYHEVSQIVVKIRVRIFKPQGEKLKGQRPCIPYVHHYCV
jgi:hypothetical protein